MTKIQETQDNIKKSVIELGKMLASLGHDEFQFIGSAALLMHGFDVVPKDIDVLCTKDLISKLYRAKRKHGDPEYLFESKSPCGRFNSKFFQMSHNDITVELIADLEVNVDGYWTKGPGIRRYANPYANIIGGAINVAPLEHISSMLGLFNRPKDRYNLGIIDGGRKKADIVDPPAAGKITFGLDFDGTITATPELWRHFVESVRAQGHKVYIVTARYPSEEGGINYWRKYVDGVIFSKRQPKNEAALAAGVAVHVWIDDTPQTIHNSILQVWGKETPEGVTHSPVHDQAADAATIEQLTAK